MGFVYTNHWSIKPGLEIGYVIKCGGSGVDIFNVPIEDIWVGVKESTKLLEAAGKKKVKDGKGPSFKSMWTITVEGIITTFCPVTEFIYHAALKSTSKHSTLFRDILHNLMSTTLSSTLIDTQNLKEYEEVETKVMYKDTPFDDVKMDYDEDYDPLQSIPLKKQARKTKEVDYNSDFDQNDYFTLDHNPIIKTEDTIMKIEPEDDWNTDLPHHEITDKPKTTTKQTKKIPCKVCGRKCRGKIALYKHCIKEHPDDTELHPPKPPVKKPRGNGVRLTHLHERGDPPLMCCLPDCGCSFSHFKGLIRHERTHNGAYICIICGKPCYSAENLIDHCDNLHKEKSEFICRVCGFFTHTEYKLKIHQEDRHMEGLREYICDECGYKTSSKNAFTIHASKHDGKVYMCEECGREFNSPRHLSTHRKSHKMKMEGQIKYDCNMCDKRFSCASLLGIHKRVHTGEKPFRCEECGQMFGSQSSLIKHRNNVHVDEEDRPYKCDECGKTFSKDKRTVYLGHVKQHNGVRDHICSICQSGFSSRAYLGKHIKKVHKVKIVDVENQLKSIQAQAMPFLQHVTKIEHN